jgi:transcriptional regulator with XRE-family HTH domain
MTGDELQDVITTWGLTQVEFARALGVTPRAVTFWLHDMRRIPGPALAYMALVNRLLPPGRYLELHRRLTFPIARDDYDAA